MPRVVFIDLINDIYDLHGVCSLLSVLKQNDIDCYYIGERNFKKAIAKIFKIQPDFLLYSAFSSHLPIYNKFDRVIKGYIKSKSIIGGVGPTFDFSCLDNSSIDAGCAGEGEIALVDYVKTGNIQRNIFCRDSLPSNFYSFVDLDSLPFPDRETIYEVDIVRRNSPSKQFLSGRGCPYDCTYCHNHKIKEIFKGCGQMVRKKSIGYLIEEIDSVKKRYPLKNVVFNDDAFILDRKWFLGFCEIFPRKIGVTYTCNIRADLIEEEMVKALKNSRCVGVNWSIESGNDFLRNVILKRRMSKEQILNASHLFNKYKIPFRIGNMIGLPSESLKQMYETLELNIKAKPTLGLANIYVPYPDLEITKYAIEHGFYIPSIEKLPHDYYTKSLLNISPKENIRIQKLLYLFPFFVNIPFLFYNTFIREGLFVLPRILLRALYEAYYVSKMKMLYKVKTSFLHKTRMAMRYINVLLTR